MIYPEKSVLDLGNPYEFRMKKVDRLRQKNYELESSLKLYIDSLKSMVHAEK